MKIREKRKVNIGYIILQVVMWTLITFFVCDTVMQCVSYSFYKGDRQFDKVDYNPTQIQINDSLSGYGTLLDNSSDKVILFFGGSMYIAYNTVGMYGGRFDCPFLSVDYYGTQDSKGRMNLKTMKQSATELYDYAHDKYPDKKGFYTLLMSLFTEDKINEFVFKVLENESIQESIANIYNQIFGEEIDRIEEEDKIISKELEEYENEAIKDETIEQHNQSIEEYAKSHIKEKIDELNEFYDEVEKANPNVVPVRDLRDLTAFIDDEEIIPPSDDEPDVLVDDGTIEIVEYLDNINDNTLEKTEE